MARMSTGHHDEVTDGSAILAVDRVSLVVGVTGHREIAAEDVTPLRKAFGNILRDLTKVAPNMPLVVLSGLAAGADSLAASEAIAQNIPVIACLPMPVEAYEADFTPNELERFRSLLRSCARVIVTSQVRENGYVASGLFVARNSHLLIALWDGMEARGAGGTGDILSVRLTGRTPFPESSATMEYFPDIGPAFQIVTPRPGAPRPADPFAVKRLFPKRYHGDAASEQDFYAIVQHMDLYNVDLARTRAPESHDQPLWDVMERTDTVANQLHRRTNVFRLILYFFAFIGATFQIIAQLPPITKFAALFVAFIFYQIARANDYENRYQDYRALAEGLRVQATWHHAGLTHHFADQAYLRMQEGELQWIRMALRSLYLTCCGGLPRPDASLPDRSSRHWLRSQWRYYYNRSRHDAALAETLRRVAIIGLAIGFGSTVVSAVLHIPAWLHLGSWMLPQGRLGTIASMMLTVPIAIAVTLAALMAHYIEQNDIATNARRYERMRRVFDRACRQLIAARDDPRRVHEILLSTGRAALVEHADWLIMRRDRPLKIIVV
jgi:hypothetical protein